MYLQIIPKKKRFERKFIIIPFWNNKNISIPKFDPWGILETGI